MGYFTALSELDAECASFAGGKGAMLGELIKRKGGLTHPTEVPSGTVLCKEAFEEWMQSAGVTDSGITAALNSIGKDTKKLEQVVGLLHGKLAATPIPEKVVLDLLQFKQGPLAVRSSGIGEDGGISSFAGQHDTILNCTDIPKGVKDVWLSAFNPRALYYRVTKDMTSTPIRQAVVIQEMVKPTIAGVAFSADPRSGDRKTAMVEYVQGLGDKLVSGEVTPKRLLIGHDDITATGNLHVVAKTVVELEHMFGWPVDMEWAWDNKLFMLQARPITALPKAYDPALIEKIKYEHEVYGLPIMMGERLAPGTIGAAGFITREQCHYALEHPDNPKGYSALSKRILLVPFTTPDDLPWMEKVAGIVVDEGGITSHAAIVCRELGKPCIKVDDIAKIEHSRDGYSQEYTLMDGDIGALYKAGIEVVL